jgi:tetratricopeptide (TPR) repeat protein
MTLPPPPTLRQGLGHRAGIGANPPGMRAGAPLGPTSRAPATRRATMGALAEADPARKTSAASEPPRAGADSPSGSAGILQRGQAAFDRGDYPEALRRGREAIAAGGALGGHLLAGDAYYRLERLPDALREYQAALALDPGNASIKRRRDLVEQAAAR